ncbi:fibromodulin-like [Scleropages formosus]|uniref:Fibromodulin n=1 Tax=Scleropages formosus TaxID=113540 RepID=A0A0P7UDI2_SCLFO|nr:fibromodulin-like [Scleropages formosus]
MRLAFILLVAGFCELVCPKGYDPFFWLMALRNRGYGYGTLQADTRGGQCPAECDCPPSFPVAMYCDDRGLREVPYVPFRMKYLYLQRNRITSIQDGAFDNATNLVWVMLHRNQLDSNQIGKMAFVKLINLDRLYLDHNILSRVPPNLPRSLRELRLNNNNISKIQSTSFEGMRNLTILQLHNNALQEVGSALKGLTSLTVLDLSKNQLKKVPEGLPKMLQQLYMEFNSISAVPANFCNQFYHLQYIRISHNELTDSGIPPNIFNASGLVELDLSFNKLEKIPPVSTSLEHLYLQANRIKEFSLSSFCSVVDVVNFSQLKVLRLDGNEITMNDVPSDAALCLRVASTIEV